MLLALIFLFSLTTSFWTFSILTLLYLSQSLSQSRSFLLSLPLHLSLSQSLSLFPVSYSDFCSVSTVSYYNFYSTVTEEKIPVIVSTYINALYCMWCFFSMPETFIELSFLHCLVLLLCLCSRSLSLYCL